MKLNVTLAKSDKLAGSFKKSLEDYIKFFKGEHGKFRGLRKTFEPSDPDKVIVDPNDRTVNVVETTVQEKLLWLTETNREYIDSVFSVEATNAGGKARGKLVVDNVDFGEYSTLELMRLKSLLEGQLITDVITNIPVRQDNRIWTATTNGSYANRAIFETEQTEARKRTTLKEQYILEDPNVANGAKTYQPVISVRDTVIDLGKMTFQEYSGEITTQERAEMLRRKTQLYAAVVALIKEANDTETKKSEMTSDKLFGYLFGDQYVGKKS